MSAYSERLRCSRCNDMLGVAEFTVDTGQVRALCVVCAERITIVMVTR